MNLFERFEVLEDPRDIRGKRYKLIDILIMTIYAILCGQEDYVNIAYFMKLKEEYFINLLGLENGTPSHDCLSWFYICKICMLYSSYTSIKNIRSSITKTTNKFYFIL